MELRECVSQTWKRGLLVLPEPALCAGELLERWDTLLRPRAVGGFGDLGLRGLEVNVAAVTRTQP